MASRGSYGYCRIHAELNYDDEHPGQLWLISGLMTHAVIYRLPGPAGIKRLRSGHERRISSTAVAQLGARRTLWVTDIITRRTRDGTTRAGPVMASPSAKPAPRLRRDHPTREVEFRSGVAAYLIAGATDADLMRTSEILLL